MVHDISPDTLTEEDGSSDLSAKEQYILSCLSQSKQKTIEKFKPKHLPLERIEDRLGLHREDRLVCQQRALEKLNNVINLQYLECQDNNKATKSLAEVGCFLI